MKLRTRRRKVMKVKIIKQQVAKKKQNNVIEGKKKKRKNRTQSHRIINKTRCYYHTSTCFPIKPMENDIVVESDEEDPEWLQKKISAMIDNHNDANNGEKEMMKMWTLHLIKNKFVGNCHIPWACEKFVEYNGKTIIKKNLYGNFILHLTNLYNFDLLTPSQMYKIVKLLQVQMNDRNTTESESWMYLDIRRNGTYLYKELPKKYRRLMNMRVSVEIMA